MNQESSSGMKPVVAFTRYPLRRIGTVEFSAQMLAGKTLEEWLSECRERYYINLITSWGDERGKAFLLVLLDSGCLKRLRETFEGWGLVRETVSSIDTRVRVSWGPAGYEGWVGYRYTTADPLYGHRQAIGYHLRKWEKVLEGARQASGLTGPEASEVLNEWLVAVYGGDATGGEFTWELAEPNKPAKKSRGSRKKG